MSEVNTRPRDGFIFYRSFLEAIKELTTEEQAKMFLAICDYGLDMIEPNFTGYMLAIWKVIKPQLTANWKKYLNGCKGGEFGVNGGAPKGNTNAKKDTEAIIIEKEEQPQNNPTITPKQPPKKKNKVKDKEKEKVKDKEEENAQREKVQSVVVQSHHSSIIGLLFDILEEKGVSGKEAGDIVERFELNVHGIQDNSPIPNKITDKNGNPINDIEAYFRAWIKPNLENVNGEYYDIIKYSKDRNWIDWCCRVLSVSTEYFQPVFSQIARKYKKEQTKHKSEEIARLHAFLETAKTLSANVPQSVKNRYKELLTPKS